MSEKKFKRLFMDLETSPNLVLSWNVGYNLNLQPENIVKERAIICVCWKWEGENKVHELHWNKGDDKRLVTEFAKIMNSADEVLGHNSDNYDIKWLRTRCLYHGVSLIPDFQTVDTLKLSRKGFRFNSNKLDYIAQFLGLGKKADTGGFSLWKEIVLNNCSKSMTKMIDYCKKDVILLEKVYQKLDPYIIHKSHVAVAQGGEPHHCPSCTSSNVVSNGVRITATGLKKRRLQCNDCGKYYQISNSVYELIKPLLEYNKRNKKK